MVLMSLGAAPWTGAWPARAGPGALPPPPPGAPPPDGPPPPPPLFPGPPDLHIAVQSLLSTC